MRMIAPAVLALVAALPGAAQEKLSLERINEPSFRAATSVPEYVWLADGTALLYDRRIPEAERTLERLDPRTGKRSPAVDAAKALGSLQAARGPEAKPEKGLGWPEVVRPEGNLALYTFDGDVYLLDLPSSSFTRLTASADEEKAPSFSPDGRSVAYVRNNNLWLKDLRSGLERQLTSGGTDTVLDGTLSWVYWEEIFGREDTAYWWSPDGSHIAFLESDESKVDVSFFPKYEPACPEVVRQRYPKAGDANPSVRLGIVALGSGIITWAKVPDPQPEYLVRVNWLPDSGRIALQALDRAQQHLSLLSVDPSTGEATPVLVESSPTSVNIHDDLTFIDGGTRFLWTSERDGHNHIYLYRMDGTLVRQLTHGDMMVRASSGLAWIKGGVVGVDERQGLVYFTASSGSPVAPALYRVPLSGGEVVRVTPREGTHRVGLDPTATYVLDAFSNVSTPPGLYLVATAGGEVRTVTPPAADVLAPYALRTPELFTIPARDGLLLPAQMTKPRDFDPAKKYPVIFYVYGGPSAPVVWNSWGRNVYFDNILLDNGFITAAMDPRSATGASKTLEDTSHRRLMSGYEVSDMQDVIAWFATQPWVDASRIGVWGWSGGGTYTLQLMTHTTLFAAGIAVAAVTDFRYYDTVWTERILGLPAENAAAYEAAAPATAAAEEHGRLLLIHGTGDDNVHPQNLWRFTDGLIKADKQFDMMLYPLQKHGIRGDYRHVFETMLRFWRSNL